jgi:hypothetical protein
MERYSFQLIATLVGYCLCRLCEALPTPYFVLDDPPVLGQATTHTAVQLHGGGLVATNIWWQLLQEHINISLLIWVLAVLAKTTVSLVPNGATEKHRDSSEQHSYNHRTLQQADPSHRVVIMGQFLRHRGRDRLNASDSAIASYFAWGMGLVEGWMEKRGDSLVYVGYKGCQPKNGLCGLRSEFF